MRPGELIGDRFKLEGLAGAGGMGAIWRAVDVASGARVALKVMLQHQNDPTRFAHEGRVLSQVRHPGIVRYVAHGATDDGLLYLAMEWLEGEDLAARLARGPLPMAQALALGARLADALGEAHVRGVVHRDIKPANIFLPHGEIQNAKLIDFGIARAAWQTGPRTAPGYAVGTIGYMAPEQARGAEDVGPPADVFALGCVLFECLSARPLFTGDHLVAVLAKVLVYEAARLSDVMSGVPPALDALLARILAKEPGERPADGSAVARELFTLAAQGPVSIAPAPPPTLSSDEMHVASVVLIGRRAGAELTHTVEAHAAEEDTARLRDLAARAGARLERLADGSLLAVVEGGLPSDQAAQAARCALALHHAMPDRPAVAATGRAPLGRRVPLGEAIDAAAALLRMPAARGVRVDTATASLLGPGFAIDGDVLSRERDAATSSAPRAPCYGRERALAELEGLFDECRADSVARAVLVTAPPGGGKSRLLSETLRRMRDAASFQLWFGRGDPVGVGSAFGILGRAMLHGLGIGAGAPGLEQRDRLVERVGASSAPFLAEIVGTPFDTSDPPEQLVAARRDPHLMYQRVRGAFEQLVRAECAREPLVIVLEDLQWGDEPSVRLLDSALRVASDRPLLVLALGRPEVSRMFTGLWPDSGSQRLLLPALTSRPARELVRALLPTATDDVLARIVDEGGGNPLLLEELARAERERPHAHAGSRTLAAMLHARLDRVPPELRLVLRAASVFGRAFWKGGVRALAGLDAEELETRISRLERAELVAPSPTSRFAGEPELVFASNLTREATYASLTDADRELGHRLAAEWLESAGEGDALILAEHSERGGASERAVHWYLLAARRAVAAADFTGAYALADRGLACGATGTVRGALLLLQAETKQWTGRLDEASGLLDRALVDLPEGTEEWLSALSLLGLGEFRRGHRAEAEAIARRLLGAGTSAEGIAAARVLELAGALVLFGRLELGARLGELARVAGDAGAQAQLLGFRAVSALMNGDLEGALEGEEAAAELLERAGDLRASSLELLNAAYFRFELGDHETAEALIHRAGDLRRSLGLPHLTTHNLARVLARRGAIDEALALEREAIAASARSGDARVEGFSRAHLATLLLGRGELETAEAEARAARDLLADAPTLRPVALATLSNVLRARGALSAALETAEEAAKAAEAGVESGEAAIALSLAEALHAAGDEAGARAVIAQSEARLLARAQRIRDAALRRSFLERVPENARTLELAREWVAA